jgi:hypothetical protein
MMLDPAAEFEARTGRPRWSATPEERSALEREASRKAFQQAQEENERARQRDAAVDAATREKLEAGMPTARALGVDVDGLGAARARLIVGKAWIEHQRAKIPALEEKRDAFLRALAMPDQTRAELAAVESKTTLALRKFYDAGSKGEMPDLHRAEREVLVERLALEDALAAECSAGLLEQAEVEIGTQHRLVAELEGRIEGWITAVMIETCAAVAPRVAKLVGELRTELSVVTALGQVAGGDLRHVAGGATLALGVPWPWDDLDLEVPGGDRVRKIVAQWEKVRAALASDPRAIVNAPIATRESIAERAAAIVEPVVAPVSTVRRLLGRGSPPPVPKVEPKPVPTTKDLGYTFTEYRDSLTPEGGE